MKKMKKLMAALLAMVMMLAMTTTAFAAKTGATITVKGLSTAANQKVDIYEIYRLDENDNAWVKAAWVPEDVTPENLDKKVAELQTAAKNATVTATETTATGTVTFTETKDKEKLQAGAYLVLATDESGKVTYNPMIAVTYKYDETTGLITVDNADVVAKAETYTTDKEQDKEVVEVGDLITYTIKTTVPYNDGKLDSFTVTDTLTGATYYLTGEPVKGVKPVNEVIVGGKPVEGIEIPAEAHGQKTFEINMTKLLEKNAYAGQEVVIRYTAKVEAVDSVTNKAVSSNDPEGTTTTAYTGTATITKYGEKNQTLKGAEFVLYRMVDGKTEYAIIKDKYVTGEWTEDLNAVKDSHTIVTDENGVATVKGLKEGTYYFKEVVAPDGYTINEKDSEVKITKTEANGQVTVGGTTEMTDTKLASLPGTGGIGTTIFTIGGCIIMIAAAGFYFLSRKKENN